MRCSVVLSRFWGESHLRERLTKREAMPACLTVPPRTGLAGPMNTIRRMSFSFDRLIDQIIEGRKTASAEWMQRQGELDEWDSALEVGAVYTVCDSQRTARCTIRVTSIRLCRWGGIPEWLWRGETNSTPDEFRADHVEYFENPGNDFEFVGYEFELVDVIGAGTGHGGCV